MNKYQPFIWLLTGLLSIVNSGQVKAENQLNQTEGQNCWPKIQSIEIQVLDIYDPDQTAWYQRLANVSKINTKKNVVSRLLPFAAGDAVCQSQIDEAERILRAVRYLREPQISIDENGKMLVVVRDSWTLFPTYSAGRKGGKNHFAFGVRDNNLLGLGLGSSFSYKSDEQLSGYRFRLTSPFYWVDKATVEMVLEDYEEGTASKFTFDKPFYTQNDPHGYNFGFSDEDLQYTVFHNSGDELLYQQHLSIIEGQFGWLTNVESHLVERFSLGVRSFEKRVDPLTTFIYNDLATSVEQNLLFARYDYQQLEFAKLRNLRLISTIEDVNFGVSFSLTLGAGNYTIGDDQGSFVHMDSHLSDGWRIGDLLLFNDLHIRSENYSDSPDFNFAQENFEIFYDIGQAGTLYWGSEYSYLSHYYFNVQSVGDETGVRGFPLQYQHGKNRWASHLEFHQFTDLDLFESVFVGISYFIDAGRAWNNSSLENIEPGTLHSVGVGLRFYPHVVSGKNVVHVDLARAFSKIAEVDGYDIRITIDQSF